MVQSEEERRLRRNARQRKWREKNRDKVVAARKANYAEDPDRHIGYVLKWQQSHPEWREKHNAVMREYANRNKEKIKSNRNQDYYLDWRLKRKYGITIENFREMQERQNHKCVICGLDRKLNVDHDHGTGKVRDLLCKKCNMGLGYFDEDPERLTKASEYLRKHGKTG